MQHHGQIAREPVQRRPIPGYRYLAASAAALSLLIASGYNIGYRSETSKKLQSEAVAYMSNEEHTELKERHGKYTGNSLGFGIIGLLTAGGTALTYRRERRLNAIIDTANQENSTTPSR